MGPYIQYPWLSSNIEISYPFMPQVWPKYVASIFSDAYIVDGTNLRVGVAPINEPLKLVQFELTDANTAGLMQLQYVDDGSLFFFDNTPPTTEYRVWDFGDWKIVSADNQEERKYVRLVLYTPSIPAYPFTLSVFIDGLDAVFVSRVHEQNLPKVHSIQVTDTDTGITHVLNEDVEFYPGYNMSFSVENQKVTSDSYDNSDQRLLTAVTMSADPGSGEGRRPIDCEVEAESIRQVNFLPPDDNGNLLFNLDGTMRSNFVYTGTGIVIVREPGALELDNDGAACCTCDDYGDAYNSINDLQDDAINVANGAKVVREKHCEIVESMTTEALCREQLAIKLQLIPKSAWLVTIMIIFQNNPKCELNAPPVTLTISSDACDGSCVLNTNYELVPGTPYVYNQGVDETWRKTIITSPTSPGVTSEVVPGNSYMALAYDILFTDEEVRDCEQIVNVTADAGDWGAAIASTELICPLRDPDPDDCADVTEYPPDSSSAIPAP